MRGFYNLLVLRISHALNFTYTCTRSRLSPFYIARFSLCLKNVSLSRLDCLGRVNDDNDESVSHRLGAWLPDSRQYVKQDCQTKVNMLNRFARQSSVY